MAACYIVLIRIDRQKAIDREGLAMLNKASRVGIGSLISLLVAVGLSSCLQ